MSLVLSFPACPPFSSNCSLQTQRNFLEVSSLMISLNEVFPVIQTTRKWLPRWCLRKHCPIFLVLKYCQNFSFHLVNIARDPKKGTKNI